MIITLLAFDLLVPVRVINIIIINIITESNIVVDSTDQNLFSISRKLPFSLWKRRRDFVGADEETLENDGTKIAKQ